MTEYVRDFLLLLYKFINFWLCWVFVAVWAFSLVAESRDSSLDAMCRSLVVLAFLLAEHRLSVRGALVSAVVVHRFSCPLACGVFPDGGLNLCPLHWQVGC